jgi:hypothetical protein
MVFPIVAASDPGDHDLKKTVYVWKLSCKSELFWLILFKEDFSITPTYLAFRNYHPFEENLAVYLNNFEFPLSKDVLYQV